MNRDPRIVGIVLDRAVPSKPTRSTSTPQAAKRPRVILHASALAQGRPSAMTTARMCIRGGCRSIIDGCQALFFSLAAIMATTARSSGASAALLLSFARASIVRIVAPSM